MNEMMNMLLAVVKTGDEADMGKWITIMVVVGVILVVMAVVSIVLSKKQKAQDTVKDEKKKDE